MRWSDSRSPRGSRITRSSGDFAARFRYELRQIAPVAVGVVNTRLYANWKYADAFKRVSVEAIELRD
jgi:hypothetical protein